MAVLPVILPVSTLEILMSPESTLAVPSGLRNIRYVEMISPDGEISTLEQKDSSYMAELSGFVGKVKLKDVAPIGAEQPVVEAPSTAGDIPSRFNHLKTFISKECSERDFENHLEYVLEGGDSNGK